ncbi:MAG: ABC transporter permease [Eubacteriaceae bacterium]
MNLIENIRLALEGLRANKMRALLTMLGIIIGISSVIAISTLGSAMTGSVNESFDSIGGKNIMLNLSPKDYNSASELTPEDLFSEEELQTFREKYQDKIKGISLNSSLGSGEIKNERFKQEVTVTGVNPDYGIVNKTNLIQGRFVNDRDLQSAKNVVVIEKALRDQLVGQNGNPIGKEISVETKNGRVTYTIIGVYENITDYGPLVYMQENQRIELFIPITTVQESNSQNPGYDSLIIMATPETDSKAFSLLAESYFIGTLDKTSDFTVFVQSMEAIASEATASLGILSLGISVIAGISLLVGGIGVMNIMLVSVTERTKEIGIRKALGAKNAAIRIQFIVEAIIICLVGGIIGVCLGGILGTYGSSLLGFPVGLPTDAVIFALCFSMGIGVFFGYYPANKAAKLDPIDALRYE